MPYQRLVDEGYEVDIATPGGRLPALDPESLDGDYWKENLEELARALEIVETLPQMRSTVEPRGGRTSLV
jgi:putative intracellular protease/amidase